MADRKGHGDFLLDEQNRHALFVARSVAPLCHAVYVSRFRNSGNVEMSVFLASGSLIMLNLRPWLST